MTARGAAALTACALMLGLTGCAPGASTGLTVSYEVDGAARTVTFTPDQITCDDASVHGLSLSNDPQGRFSIALSGDRRGSVGAGSDDGLVLFEATELDLSADGDVLTVGASDGEVAVVEGWESGDDVTVTPEDAQRYPATLSGSVTCDAPVTVPTPEAEPEDGPTPDGVSVTFTAGDDAHTATFTPGTISCETRVTATGVDPHPGTLIFDGDGGVQVTVSDDEGTTRFRADDVAAAPDADGVYWFRGIDGDVQFWAGQSGGTLAAEDAEEGEGTLNALIICP